MKGIAADLHASMRAHPNTRFSIAHPDHINEMTVKDLHERALAYGAELKPRISNPDRTVCLIPDQDPLSTSIAILGTILTGAVPFVGNHGTTVPDHLRQTLQSIGRDIQGAHGLTPAAQDSVFAHPDLAFLQSTSGTTGLPNLCMWGHAGIATRLKSMAEAMHLQPDDKALCWTPLSHTVGVLNNLLLCMMTGTSLTLMDRGTFARAPLRWLSALSQTRTTQTWAPNFAVALITGLLRDQDPGPLDLSALRAIWNAGERVDAPIYQRFGAALAKYGLSPHTLKTNYGSSEHCGGATFGPQGGELVIEGGSDLIPSAHGSLFVSVGQAAPGVSLIIRDDAGNPMPDAHLGEICIEATGQFLGYAGQPGATTQVLHGHELATGDLGYLRDGHLFWVGRKQETLNIRGRKIDPSQFQPVLDDALKRATQFVAFGVDDTANGTQNAVLIMEANNDIVATERMVRRAILTRFGITLHRVIVVMPGVLRKTALGKTRHRHYKRLYLAGHFDAAP